MSQRWKHRPSLAKHFAIEESGCHFLAHFLPFCSSKCRKLGSLKSDSCKNFDCSVFTFLKWTNKSLKPQNKTYSVFAEQDSESLFWNRTFWIFTRPTSPRKSSSPSLSTLSWNNHLICNQYIIRFPNILCRGIRSAGPSYPTISNRKI